jgi:hypothetical protein
VEIVTIFEINVFGDWGKICVRGVGNSDLRCIQAGTRTRGQSRISATFFHKSISCLRIYIRLLHVLGLEFNFVNNIFTLKKGCSTIALDSKLLRGGGEDARARTFFPPAAKMFWRKLRLRSREERAREAPTSI